MFSYFSSHQFHPVECLSSIDMYIFSFFYLTIKKLTHEGGGGGGTRRKKLEPI